MLFYKNEPSVQDPNILTKPSLTGVILVNLGTPDEPTPSAIRRYLAEFLSDRRIIEAPKWFWYPILHGIILRTRPKKVAANYKKVWTDDGSPLLNHSIKLAQGVAQNFPNNVVVKTAMRYGNPSIESVLSELRNENLQRLLVIPLFPQYSATTTASVIDKLSSILTQWRVIPEYRILTEYYSHPSYIGAICEQIKSHWQQKQKSEKLLFSFHGLPQQYINAGDIYQVQCTETAKLIAQRLDLKESEWIISFQSLFGPKKWIQPYTSDTLIKFGKEGINSIDIVCPGFAVDCLETIEEINIQNRKFFMNAGGKDFHYIPALNHETAHIDLMTKLIKENASNWMS